MNTSINLNNFKHVTIKAIIEATGLVNNYKSQPLCIQKARLLRDAELAGKIQLIK